MREKEEETKTSASSFQSDPSTCPTTGSVSLFHLFKTLVSSSSNLFFPSLLLQEKNKGGKKKRIEEEEEKNKRRGKE